MIYDEQQLWNQFRNGDKEALSAIAEKHFRSLLRYGLKFGLEAVDTEDCIQDLFLDLWQNRLQINDTLSVRNYLFKSIRHRIIALYRKNTRLLVEEPNFTYYEFSDFKTIESDWIEQEYLQETAKKLQKGINELPKREKEALYLRYYENYSIAEIAEIMNVNRQSAANFLQKALTKLRQKYQLSELIIVLALHFSFK